MDICTNMFTEALAFDCKTNQIFINKELTILLKLIERLCNNHLKLL